MTATAAAVAVTPKLAAAAEAALLLGQALYKHLLWSCSNRATLAHVPEISDLAP